MPFSYNASITDLNDAIVAAVNAKVSTETSTLSTRLNTAQADVDSLEGRATTLENNAGSTPPPAPAPKVNSHTITRTSNGVNFTANVSNISSVVFRMSATPITTQAGWNYPRTADASGNVSVVSTTQDSTSTLYWQLEDAADRTKILVSGQVGAYVDPNPTPTPTPTGDFTGGNGGSKTDQTNVSWSNGTVSSSYHIYAGGLDWTKSVGILVYGDGSAEYGLRSGLNTNYLMQGTNGLIAVAKKHNLLLVTPMAPGNGCTDGDGVCWYMASNDGTSRATKVKWSFDLVQKIYGEYNIDKSRVVIGGYSSGAQWTSQFFIPQYGTQIMSDGLFVPISFGGAPAVTTTFTADFKSKVVGSWDCGTNDEYGAYGTESYNSRGGYNWYTSNGFTTDYKWVTGGTHDRSNEFGTIMDREITQHLKTA